MLATNSLFFSGGITQPIVIQQQPPYMQQPYPAVTGYHQETITDANCNCLRTVLVPNQ